MRILRWKTLRDVAIVLAFFAGTAQAVPLGLTVGDPDITAANLTFTYDPSGGLCGGAYTLCLENLVDATVAESPLIPTITNGKYRLAANVSTTGVLSDGTLVIDDAAGPPTFLTALLTGFGFELIPGVGGVIEFLGNVTGGDLAPYFPQVGVTAYVPDFASFASSFTSPAGTVNSDNFAVPEPTSLALLAVGTAMALRRRRRS